MEYEPVQTKTDLATLDHDQVLAGYLSVLDGNYSRPGSDKTRLIDAVTKRFNGDQEGLLGQIVNLSRLD